MNRPPSALMCVGRKFYKLHEMVEEYKAMGISKRIPATSIPEGLVPLKSKLFVAHPDAIIRVTADDKTLMGLAMDLVDEGLLLPDDLTDITSVEMDFWRDDTLQSEDYVPTPMLTLAMAYSRSEHRDQHTKMYGIETCMGVVGYAYLDRIEYVVRDGEEELPENLAHLEGEIDLVSYTYEEDNDDNS